MKTYQDLVDHFADRPEMQEKLILYINEYWPEANGDLTSIEPDPTLAKSLVTAFIWSCTEEGHDYWSEIHSELCKIDKL